ncbi:MAG: hypothetical protein ACOZNI_03170 [Myxococcota bacterium]
MFLIAILACSGGSADDTGKTAGGFEGGMFTVTTTGVDDQCADGAFATIFMPEGTAEQWDNAVELPSSEDLPAEMTLTVQDPYGTMTVTVEEGSSDTQFVIDGVEATDIPVDGYDGCIISQSIGVVLNVTDPDNLTGTATMSTTGMDEAECPSQVGSCTVTLDISATRQ